MINTQQDNTQPMKPQTQTPPVPETVNPDTPKEPVLGLILTAVLLILALGSAIALQAIEADMGGYQLDRRNYFLAATIGLLAAALYTSSRHFKHDVLYLLSLPLATVSLGMLIHELLLDQPYAVSQGLFNWATLLTIAFLPWATRLSARLHPETRRFAQNYDTIAIAVAVAAIFKFILVSDDLLSVIDWSIPLFILIFLALRGGYTQGRTSSKVVGYIAIGMLGLSYLAILFFYG